MVIIRLLELTLVLEEILDARSEEHRILQFSGKRIFALVGLESVPFLPVSEVLPLKRNVASDK